MLRKRDTFTQGTKVYIEQAVPALTRMVNGQVEHARIDFVFGHNGSTTHLDVVTVTPFSSSPVLLAAGRQLSTRQPCPVHPGDHWPPWTPRQKVHQQPHEDADNPPLAIRDTWSANQSVLRSAISKQQLSHSHVTLGPASLWPLCPLLHRPFGNTHCAPAPPRQCAAALFWLCGNTHCSFTPDRPSRKPAQVQPISTAQAGKHTRRRDDLHRFHVGLFVAPQPSGVA